MRQEKSAANINNLQESQKQIDEDVRPLTISHEVVTCPTAKDYEKACQEFCNYTRTNLAPYINRPSTSSDIDYNSEVM